MVSTTSLSAFGAQLIFASMLQQRIDSVPLFISWLHSAAYVQQCWSSIVDDRSFINNNVRSKHKPPRHRNAFNSLWTCKNVLVLHTLIVCVLSNYFLDSINKYKYIIWDFVSEFRSCQQKCHPYRILLGFNFFSTVITSLSFIHGGIKNEIILTNEQTMVHERTNVREIFIRSFVHRKI